MAKLLKLDGDGVVYAGSAVTGKVLLDGSFDDVKEVTVKLHGRGETAWTEFESVYDAQAKKHVSRPVSYKQTEDYVLQKQTLWTDAPGIPMTRGQVLPFGFVLPVDIPPTFRGSYGFIQYSVGVKIRRPMLKFDKEETVFFAVIPLCSMAHLRNMMEPVVMKKEKELAMLFWKRGYIGASVSLPKQVYILGDVIPVSGQVTNHSSVVIRKTKASVHQSLTYHCAGKTKVEKTAVSKVKQGEIAPGTIFTWNNVALPVPKNMPPSDFGPRCRLFQADHRFEFVVDPSGMHFDLELGTPLKLGSVWGHPPPMVPVSPVSVPVMPVSAGPFGFMPSPMAPMPFQIPAASAPPLVPEQTSGVLFDAPPTYDEACGGYQAPVEVGQEAKEGDDIAKDFEKVALS